MFSPPSFSFYSQRLCGFSFSFVRHQYSLLEDSVSDSKGEEMCLLPRKGPRCEGEGDGVIFPPR